MSGTVERFFVCFTNPFGVWNIKYRLTNPEYPSTGILAYIDPLNILKVMLRCNVLSEKLKRLQSRNMIGIGLYTHNRLVGIYSKVWSRADFMVMLSLAQGFVQVPNWVDPTSNRGPDAVAGLAFLPKSAHVPPASHGILPRSAWLGAARPGVNLRRQ